MTQPDRENAASLSFESAAVHVGNVHMGSRMGTAVRTPIVMANSYELPYDAPALDWHAPDQFLYQRNTGVNQNGLEKRLAALEGAEECVVFATGVAAMYAVFFTTLKSGDHVVCTNIGYNALRRILEGLLPTKYGIQTTFVDTSDLAAVRAAIRPTTKLVHCEVLANPVNRVQDIDALAAIAHDAGAIFSVDSTYTPPGWFRPLEHGADIVQHSLTKYINGHGDAMGGAVLGNHELLEPIRIDAQVDMGAALSPFNAWLITRGSVTLPLRLRHIAAATQQIAEFLEAHPKIAHVDYPGLPSHPQHELAARQLPHGFGGTIAFCLEGTQATQSEFVSKLRLVTSAVSLGHDESLIVHLSLEDAHAVEFADVYKSNGILRFSMGLENPEDIIADLAAALETI
ncbi:MAG: aminotransferase class V-fold PLP-dependent enzyme [Ruaniaceae bacterium]|nr:aminotransferase class V-fold PLP-dependent enzyme [Ruaniaceae bacterium]